MSIKWMRSSQSDFSAPINNLFGRPDRLAPINNIGNAELRDDNGAEPLYMPIANQIQQLRSKRQSIDNFSDIGGFAARKIMKNSLSAIPSIVQTGYDLYKRYNEGFSGGANALQGYTPRTFEEET